MLAVALPAADVRLRLRWLSDTQGPVLTLDREAYVAAVLAGEASSSDSPESLKALAVAVRSYAARFAGRHRAEGFDFCDTTHCQDARVNAVAAPHRAAADDTASELLWFEGRPAATFHHQDCGGQTAAASDVWPDMAAPYLRSQPDTYCGRLGRLTWESRAALPDLASALTRAGLRPPALLRDIVVASRTPSGRASSVQLRGDGERRVSAAALRMAVGRSLGWALVRSDRFDVRVQGREAHFRGSGGGHGVGLCQRGAARMGVEGRPYAAILAHYYPGTVLGLTASGLSWRRLGGERLDLVSTQPDTDRPLLALAHDALRAAERSVGWSAPRRPRLQVFPNVAVFRDATGEPGFVAASTLGYTVRLAAWRRLQSSDALQATLHHELLHVLIESRAHPGLPAWFREGLALELERPGTTAPLMEPADIDQTLRTPRDQTHLRRAYRAAHARVHDLVLRYGRPRVLAWVTSGLPQNAP